MSDGAAFPQDTEFAFPQAADQDEAAASAQRNEQIQAAFDQQRNQRSFMQGLGKEIAQVRQRQAQKQGG